MDTLYIGEGYILSLWISVTIHLIGYIYMMQMFYSIFDFDSDSRPHFQPETAQRFIYCNKFGFFVHKRRVCKEHWELVLTFTKLDISIWCRCFLSIFDFYSDSKPHFWSESVQRFIYCKKIGYFVHRRRLYFVIVNLCYHSLNWVYLYDAEVFFQFSILIRILNLISDPRQPRDSFIVIKLDSLSIREEFVRSIGN